MVKGPGTVILIGFLVSAQHLDIAHLHRLRPANFADHARHDLARAMTSFDFGRMVDVDAAQRVGKAVEITLAADFTVGDYIQADDFLHTHSHRRGIVLRFFQKRFLHAPDFLQAHARWRARQHDVVLHQPVRLRQTAHQRGRHQHIIHDCFLLQ
jgi:hypothetical protein